MKRSTVEVNAAFHEVLVTLRTLGWLITNKPICRAIDDEWIFRLKSDRLDFLFVSESELFWQRKRFTREPFGNFTNCYQPKGSGCGASSLFEGAQSGR